MLYEGIKVWLKLGEKEPQLESSYLGAACEEKEVQALNVSGKARNQGVYRYIVKL